MIWSFIDVSHLATRVSPRHTTRADFTQLFPKELAKDTLRFITIAAEHKCIVYHLYGALVNNAHFTLNE